MRIDDRHIRQARAQKEFLSFFCEWSEYWDLTFGETLGILADQIASETKGMRKIEKSRRRKPEKEPPEVRKQITFS